MLKSLFQKPEPKKPAGKKVSKPKRKSDLQKQENSGIVRNPDGTFPKGISGNPKGRPRLPKEGRNLGAKFRAMLAEVVEDTESGAYTVEDKILDVIRDYAEKGDFKFIEYMHARAYGKVPDHLIVGEESEEDRLDYGRLTLAELTIFRALINRAKIENGVCPICDKPADHEITDHNAGETSTFRLELLDGAEALKKLADDLAANKNGE